MFRVSVFPQVNTTALYQQSKMSASQVQVYHAFAFQTIGMSASLLNKSSLFQISCTIT